MKIGYFCSEYPGLSHTFITREIEILEREGFQVITASVNATRGLEKMGADDQARAARTEYLKTSSFAKLVGTLIQALFRGPRFWSTLAYSLKMTWRAGPRSLVKAIGYFVQAVLLDSWARRNALRHVHVHFANAGATVALIAAKLGYFQFSMSVHGPDEFYEETRLLLREKVTAAVFVRCISYYCRSQLMRLVPSDQWPKFHIVRCGIHSTEFVARPPTTDPVRQILCVGRVCANKGQATLVHAAHRLHSQGLEFQILLLGGGDDLELIRALVTELGLDHSVTVTGAVGHSRVKAELERADLFVLPSFAEGIPVALMEAMAAGIPVVSTMITGIPELIEHGVNGFLTQASNVDQLAEVLEGLIRGTTKTDVLVANAIQTVKKNYDVGRNTSQLATLFRELPGLPGGSKAQ